MTTQQPHKPGIAIPPISTAPSRRAVLVGALGGIGALAAGAIGRAAPVRAAGDDGSAIEIGGLYGDVQSQTTLGNSANDETVLWVASNNDLGHGAGIANAGYSYSGTGVYGLTATGKGVWGESGGTVGVRGLNTGSGYGVWGTAGSGTGVYGNSTGGIGTFGGSSTNIGVHGQSTSSIGVVGFSSQGTGVSGRTDAADEAGVSGTAGFGGNGVFGTSGSGAPLAKSKTGVYGYAGQDKESKGVWGQSPKGRAIQGSTSSGYAGYFGGKVYTTHFYELREIANPVAPPSNRLRLFGRDNGSGKTQLCVRFATGGVQVLATQP